MMVTYQLVAVLVLLVFRLGERLFQVVHFVFQQRNFFQRLLELCFVSNSSVHHPHWWRGIAILEQSHFYLNNRTVIFGSVRFLTSTEFRFTNCLEDQELFTNKQFLGVFMSMHKKKIQKFSYFIFRAIRKKNRAIHLARGSLSATFCQ